MKSTKGSFTRKVGSKTPPRKAITNPPHYYMLRSGMCWNMGTVTRVHVFAYEWYSSRATRFTTSYPSPAFFYFFFCLLPVLLGFLNCPLWIAPFIFSNVYCKFNTLVQISIWKRKQSIVNCVPIKRHTLATQTHQLNLLVDFIAYYTLRPSQRQLTDRHSLPVIHQTQTYVTCSSVVTI
jgi:hypothetical protein